MAKYTYILYYRFSLVNLILKFNIFFLSKAKLPTQ